MQRYEEHSNILSAFFRHELSVNQLIPSQQPAEITERRPFARAHGGNL